MNERIDPRLEMGGNNPPLADQLNISEREIIDAAEAIAKRANDAPKTIDDKNAEAATALIGSIVVDAQALFARLEKRRAVVKDPYLRGGQAVDLFFGGAKDRMTLIAGLLPRRIKTYRDAKRAEEQRLAAEEAERQRKEEAERLRAAAAAEAKGRQATAVLEQERAKTAATAAAAAQTRVEQAQAPMSVQPAKTAVSEDLTMTTTAEWTYEVKRLDLVDLAVLRPFFKPDHLQAAIKAAVKGGVRELNGVRIYQEEAIKFR